MTTATTKQPTEPTATEGEVLALLERHYARPGNGGAGQYAFLRQVRNNSGFDATRTFDAIVIGLWPSRGHDIHVLEVKVSRSDWRRELAKPDKAEDAARIADRFSVVAPRGVIDHAEVPATWGLIEIHGGIERVSESPPLFPGDPTGRTLRTVEGRKVRVVRAAPLLRPPEECRGPIPRGVLIAMLRAAGAVPDPIPPDQRIIDDAVRDAVTRERDQTRGVIHDAREMARAAAEEMHSFRALAGVYWHGDADMRARAAEIKTALTVTASPRHAAGLLDRTSQDLRRTVQRLEQIAADLRAEAGPTDPTGETP